MTRAAARGAVLLAALLALLATGDARAGEPDPLAPAYDVELKGADRGFRWSGRVTIAVTNPDATPLGRVWVRLWGNGLTRCSRPAVEITAATGAVLGRSAVGCTAVPLDLATPIAPGGRGEVQLEVEIRVPRVVDRFGIGGRGVALLSNALPALAHREHGRWRLNPYFSPGEAWTYPAADWRVRLAAPDGVAVAAPGVLQPDGARLLRRARDYSWAAGRLRALRGTVAGVAVTVWAPLGRSRAEQRAVLRAVRRRLPQLARLFGPYGWPDLEVVITDAAAMEHTALVMTPAIDIVLTHELAHEWWYALLGNDQAAAPWLDEGFATWSESAVFGTSFHCPALPRLAPMTTRGIGFYRVRPFSYGAVYDGGACLLARLERRVGRARFRAALRRYALAHRYGWHTAEAFKAAIEAAAGGRPLGDLWRRWRVR